MCYTFEFKCKWTRCCNRQNLLKISIPSLSNQMGTQAGTMPKGFSSCNWSPKSADPKVQRLSGWALDKERIFCGWGKRSQIWSPTMTGCTTAGFDSREGQVLVASSPGDKTDLNLSATCVSLKWALSQTSGHSPAQPTPDFGCIIPWAKSLGEPAQTSVSTKPQD